MPKSTRVSTAGKPSRPNGFPLFAHATKRWAKKVRGRLHYFGPWHDPQGALERWLEAKDYLLAGRTPPPQGDGMTVADACNHYLTHKRQILDSGELAPRTFEGYFKTCAFVVGFFGKKRSVVGLCPTDFQSLRRKMAKRWGPVSLGNRIQEVRSIFKFCDEAGLLERSIKFGPGFKKPSAKTIRQSRAANGPKMFSREELLAVLEHSGPNMRAMIHLAINGGLGNTDLGLLPISAIDLKAGWLDYPRAKTAIDRRIPLWLETATAIQEALDSRPEPKNPADAHLLFIGARGQNFVGNHRGYRVTAEMRKATKRAKVEGRTFYDLRRTFQTIAERSRDLVAVRAIMGHSPPAGDMSAVYRQTVEDDRLEAVVECVRAWLFGEEVAR